MNIVVLSDLHANARALRAALAMAQKTGFDALVILGDLLTYGVDVQETLDVVAEWESRGAPVVLGNHDQMYIDLDAGRTEYVDKLPSWIRESVELNRELLRGRKLADAFRWQRRVALGLVDFFHANPFEYGDWTYLTSESEIARALTAMTARVGVCGHTHRAGAWRSSEHGVVSLGHAIDEATEAARILVNAGSLGQPRDQARCSTFLRLSTSADRLRASIEKVDYDVAAHVAALQSARLSQATRDKLVGFFV